MNISNLLRSAQAITGKRGSGKTTKLLELVDEHIEQEGYNYIIITHTKDMAALLSKRGKTDDGVGNYKILSIDHFNKIIDVVKNIDIYIDEINLINVESLCELIRKFPPQSRVMAYTYDDPNPITMAEKEGGKKEFLLKVPHVKDLYYALRPDGGVIATDLHHFNDCVYEFTQDDIRNHGLDNDYIERISIVK
ncbi:MAG: hypothetical protein ABF991_00375 [Liquorilactobacillus hordei]|uniref:hypothetical protein n=1 Tax=Liquorilactobacillus hordei TaxID=468911 RepID=UPI0039EBD13A